MKSFVSNRQVKGILKWVSGTSRGVFALCGGSGFLLDLLLGRGLLLVNVTDGEGSESLHQASSVVASRGVGEAEHGLRHLSVELGLGVAEGRLDVDELLKVVEVTVHLDDLAVLSEDGLGSGSELMPGAGEENLPSAGVHSMAEPSSN